MKERMRNNKRERKRGQLRERSDHGRERVVEIEERIGMGERWERKEMGEKEMGAARGKKSRFTKKNPQFLKKEEDSLRNVCSLKSLMCLFRNSHKNIYRMQLLVAHFFCAHYFNNFPLHTGLFVTYSIPPKKKESGNRMTLLRKKRTYQFERNFLILLNFIIRYNF